VLQTPVLLQGKQHIIRSSIGIALASPGARPEDVVRDADIAMYTAKREGKGSSRVFTADMRSSVITRMELKAELTEALEREQFVVHYQPVIALDTGELQGLEALVRWEHPVRGLLPPAEFIPLAEETGQIVRLGAWVTMAAVCRAKALQEELDARFSISVNLSSGQLSSDVVSMVRDALVASRLDPSDLVLEVTETSLIRQDDANVDKLEALRALGVRIALDDFGTGYSSLGYLQRLPIDILKIDRSFVQCTTDGVEESALAHAIVKLGETLQLGTVGEGIETADQAQALRRFGCHSGQGYFFSKPLSADELLDHVRDLTSTAVQSVTR
jgi:EAL domain-containing protein (putative c-di-GMP-specific phosphodiesterase class I)